MKAVHPVVAAGACREPAAVHRRDRGLRATGRSCGLQRLLAELAQGVVAALEQLARDRQAGAVGAESRGRVDVASNATSSSWPRKRPAKRRTPSRSAGAIRERDSSPVDVSIHSAVICARCWSSPITIVTRGLLKLHGLQRLRG
jgi:hypothetical protein